MSLKPPYRHFDIEVENPHAMKWEKRDCIELMPKYSDIPDAFKVNKGNEWVDEINSWYFGGFREENFVPKDGVNKKKALTHIFTFEKSLSLDPKHKKAAAAFLLSLWFQPIK